MAPHDEVEEIIEQTQDSSVAYIGNLMDLIDRLQRKNWPIDAAEKDDQAISKLFSAKASKHGIKSHKMQAYHKNSSYMIYSFNIPGKDLTSGEKIVQIKALLEHYGLDLEHYGMPEHGLNARDFGVGEWRPLSGVVENMNNREIERASKGDYRGTYAIEPKYCKMDGKIYMPIHKKDHNTLNQIFDDIQNGRVNLDEIMAEYAANHPDEADHENDPDLEELVEAEEEYLDELEEKEEPGVTPLEDEEPEEPGEDDEKDSSEKGQKDKKGKEDSGEHSGDSEPGDDEATPLEDDEEPLAGEQVEESEEEQVEVRPEEEEEIQGQTAPKAEEEETLEDKTSSQKADEEDTSRYEEEPAKEEEDASYEQRDSIVEEPEDRESEHEENRDVEGNISEQREVVTEEITPEERLSEEEHEEKEYSEVKTEDTTVENVEATAEQQAPQSVPAAEPDVKDVLSTEAKRERFETESAVHKEASAPIGGGESLTAEQYRTQIDKADEEQRRAVTERMAEANRQRVEKQAQETATCIGNGFTIQNMANESGGETPWNQDYRKQDIFSSESSATKPESAPVNIARESVSGSARENEGSAPVNAARESVSGSARENEGSASVNAARESVSGSASENEGSAPVNAAREPVTGSASENERSAQVNIARESAQKHTQEQMTAIRQAPAENPYSYSSQDGSFRMVMEKRAMSYDMFHGKNDIVETTGEMFTNPYSEDVNQGVVGKSKKEGEDFRAGIASKAYDDMMHNMQAITANRLARDMEKKRGNDYIVTVTMFLNANGKTNRGFHSLKDSQKTIDDFYAQLEKKRLVRKKPSGGYDCKSLEDLAKKDPKAVLKSLGLSEGDKEAAAMMDDILLFVKKTKSYQRSKHDNYKSSQKFHQKMAKHSAGASDFYKGLEDAKTNLNKIKQTIHYSKLTMKIAARTAHHMVMKVVPGARKVDRVIRVGKAEAKERLKEKSGYNKVRDHFDKKRAEKGNEKQKKREEKDKKKKERRQRLRESSKLHERALYRAGAMTRGVVNAGKVGISILRVPGQIFSFSKVVKDKIKNVLKAVAGGWFLIVAALVGIVTIIMTILSTITAFFEPSEYGVELNVKTSVMGKAYEALQQYEMNWAQALGDSEYITSMWGLILYSENHIPVTQYAPTINGIVSYDSSQKAFMANPFGFTPLDTGIYKPITKLDGGSESTIVTYGEGVGTSNIKEILTMAQVYYGYEDLSYDPWYNLGTAWTSGTNWLKAKASGIFFGETEASSDEEGWNLNARSMKKYATELFEASHQEVVDLEYLQFATCYTDSVSGTANLATQHAESTGDTGEESTTNTVLDKCTDYDLGGCMRFDNFYYQLFGDNVGIAVQDISGAWQNMGQSVQPVVGTGFSEEKKSVAEAACFTGMTEKEALSKIASDPGCWSVSHGEATSSSSESNTKPEDLPELTDNQKKFIELAGLSDSGINSVSGFTANGSTMTATAEKVDVSSQTSDEKDVCDESGRHYGQTVSEKTVEGVTGYYHADGTECASNIHINSETTYTTQKTSYDIVVRWSCAGGHSGRFCGGHLASKVTGIVYSITADQADENALHIEGKEQEVLAWDGVNTSVDTGRLFSSSDIFDVDSAITHSKQPDDWEGWTADNIALVNLKYNQDWASLYGVEIAPNIGGSPLTASEKKAILEALKVTYPNLSQERYELVERALNYVGMGGYSQAHHPHGYLGKCNIFGVESCNMTDCTGWTSFITEGYKTISGLYTTATYWGAFKLNDYSVGVAQPGDIIIRYDKDPHSIRGDGGDHALLYIGKLNFDDSLKEKLFGDIEFEDGYYTIDCSTVDGVGNIFFRKRSYVNGQKSGYVYYIDIDNPH
jgi:hypothetical protein